MVRYGSSGKRKELGEADGGEREQRSSETLLLTIQCFYVRET